jgi:hypothetical protein
MGDEVERRARLIEQIERARVCPRDPPPLVDDDSRDLRQTTCPGELDSELSEHSEIPNGFLDEHDRCSSVIGRGARRTSLYRAISHHSTPQAEHD